MWYLFEYCPSNITVHDIYGISHFLLSTVSSVVLTSIVVIFGSIEILVYDKYAKPIDDISQIPSNSLYNLQLCLLILMSIFPSVNLYYLHKAHFYKYMLVTSSLSCVSFLFSVRLVLRERFSTLPLVTRRGHGFVLIIFWTLTFINENISLLNLKNREWCFYDLRDVTEISLSIIRYVCSFGVVVLGLKAPGIISNGYENLKNDHEKGEDDDDDDGNDSFSLWTNGKKNIKRLVQLLWENNSIVLKCQLFSCIGFLLVERSFNLIIPIYNQRIVDKLGEKVFCWDLILIYIGFKFIQGGGSSGVLDSIRGWLWNSIENTTTRQIQVDLFAHLHKLSLRWHLSRRTGEVLSVMDRGPECVICILDWLLFLIIPKLMDILIAAMFFSYSVDWYFGLLVLIIMAIYIPVIIFLTDWQMEILRRVDVADYDLVSQSMDSLLNFETVKYYGAEKYEVDNYEKAILASQSEGLISFGTSCVLGTVQNIIICGSELAGSLVSAYLVVEKDSLTPGQYVLIGSYIVQLFSSLNVVGSIYNTLQEYFVRMECLFDLLDEKPEIVDAPDATELTLTGGKIDFKDVTFGYVSERVILKNISFKIPSGRTLAIVGPTGSGKSTIIRLLFRFYDVQSGSISIDGQNVAHVTQESLHRAIGVVPQDTVLFNNTLMYNIRYGRLDATDDEVFEASKAADIHDSIMNFPDKYETEVGERGLRLSGGEKQRVAIARTILKGPSIVLLDEATSSLDTQTERNIQAALSKVCANRTTVIVAHRLSTIIHADEILVLKDGEIAERGRHEDLLDKNGIYADMWNKQVKNDDDIDNEKDKNEKHFAAFEHTIN